MGITTEVTTLTLTGSGTFYKAKLPNGDLYHKHVIWVDMKSGAVGTATEAEIKWAVDGGDSNPAAADLYTFGEVLTTTDGESIIHDGIAPEDGALWIVANGTCEEVKHYAYDRRQFGLSK
jgi:hypothetical protein